MPHYRITLRCCQRVIRVRLPSGVALSGCNTFCDKCNREQFYLDPPEWQNISRNYTTDERNFDNLYDCLARRRNAA